MAKEIVFKLARDFDPTQIITFWRENDVSLSPTDTEEQLREAVRVNPELFIVAAEGASCAIAGTVWGNFDGRRGFVVHLAVRRGLRGTGLGRALMDRLENLFRAKGVHKIHLFVEKTNLDVIGYYRERGFVARDDLVILSKTFD